MTFVFKGRGFSRANRKRSSNAASAAEAKLKGAAILDTPGPSPQPLSHTAHVRVRYAETDQMGVVYHANYLVWFEIGRVELMRSRGLTYKQMEAEAGLGMAVVEVTARYKAPARYDDELAIETRLVQVRSSLVRFGYRIVRIADGRLLCEGESAHVVVGRDMKRASMPKKYADLLAVASSTVEHRAIPSLTETHAVKGMGLPHAQLAMHGPPMRLACHDRASRAPF